LLFLLHGLYAELKSSASRNIRFSALFEISLYFSRNAIEQVGGGDCNR
jgi:hypothetical protein